MDAVKDIVKLQREELNIGYINDLVTAPNCGAISNFIGITRDNFDNKKVTICLNFNCKSKHVAHIYAF